MKNIKFTRIIAMLLCVLMLVSSLPVTVLAAEIGTTTGNSSVGSTSSQNGAYNAGISTSADNGEATVFYYTTDAYLPISTNTNQYTSVTVVNGLLNITLSNSFPTLTVSENIYVEKNLVISGSGADHIVTVNGDIIVGGDLTLNNCTLKLSEGSHVYVGGSIINLTSATVDTAKYVGFAAVDTVAQNADTAYVVGEKIVNAIGATLNHVDAFGVNADCAATVTLNNGIPVGTDFAVYADYPFAYYDTAGNVISDPVSAGLPEHYRVCHNDAGGLYAGLHYNNRIVAETSGGATLTLPTESGWQWKPTADGTLITSVDNSQMGQAIELYAYTVPNNVIISYVLGYTPTDTTNDNPDDVTAEYSVTFRQDEGTTITLKTPWRMGYKFVGWKVTTGNKNNDELIAPTDGAASFICTLNSLWVDEDNGLHTLTFEAVWEAKHYTVRFQVGGAPDSDDFTKLRVKIKEGGAWLTMAQLIAEYPGLLKGDDYDRTNHVVEYAKKVRYDTNINEYFAALGIDCFEVKFEGSGYSMSWAETFRNSGLSAEKGSFTYGSGGFFGSSLPAGYSTLEAFETAMDLHLMPVFQPKWTSINAAITFNNTDWDGVWSIWLNEKDEQGSYLGYEQHTPVGGKLSDVASDTKIQFRVKTSDTSTMASFGLWTLTAGGSILSVKEAAGVVTVDDVDYLVYEFTMPGAEVTADFNNSCKITLNLKTSPITDAEITTNGITRTGFWTNELISSYWPLYDAENEYGYVQTDESIVQGKGYSNNVQQDLRYFYEWPKNGDMYVTTGDANTSYDDYADGTKNGTQNQYRAIKYIGSNRKIYLVDCHLWATDAYSNMTDAATESIMPEACNIFYTINGTKDENGYIQTYFVGNNNIIAAMGQEQKMSWMDLHAANTISKVQLGSLMGASYQRMYDLDIAAYEHPTYKDNCEHLTVFLGTYVRANKCKIDLPKKSMRQCEYTDCTVNVDQYFGGGTPLGLLGNSIMVVNEITFSYQLKVTDNSSLIVKKTVKDGYKDYTSVSEIDTMGLVLIMSDRFSTPHLKITNGTVLANTISTNALYVQGGTVVVNNMRNMAAMGGNAVASNGDGDFLSAYNVFAGHNQATTGMNKVAWRFSGGDVYLMGQKCTDFSQSSLNALVGSNTFTDIETFAQEVQAVLAGCTDEAIKNIYQESKANYSQNECIMFGNSSVQYTDTNGQSFLFDGANIYCAGRMTLFNTTNITGGTIETPVLSCKQDVTITGGTINAGEVGNSASVLVGSEGLKRYAKTTITGGTINGVTKIGAVSKPTYQTVENCSYVTVGGTAVINTSGGANIQIDRDIYINYPTNAIRTEEYESLTAAKKAEYVFIIPDSAPVYINMYVVGDPNSFDALEWSSDSGSFGNPTHIASQNSSYGWTIEDGQPKLTVGYTDTLLLGEGLTEEEKALVGKDYIRLFPYIVIPRDLMVYQDSSIVQSFTINGVEQADLSVGENMFSAIIPGNSLVFKLNKNMTDKVVLWYKDENGVYHNLMEEGVVSNGGKTVSFAMPNLDNVELYICDEMPLYFNKMDIQINNDGFNVEIDPAREDAKFRYLGGLYISRDDGKNIYLDNKIVVSENYVRADSRPVTLNQYNCALDIRENADVLFYLDGKQECPNHKMIGYNATAIEFVGKNAGRTDGWDKIAYLDIGGTKKVTFRNLTFSMETLTITNGKVNILEVIDCNVPQWGKNLNYASDVPNVYIENSHIFVCNEDGIQRANKNCTMTIKNSTITSSSNNIFSCEGWTAEGGNVILDNTRVNCPGDPYYQPITGTDRENEMVLLTSLTLKNGSIFYNPTSFRISESLTIDENSKLYVGVDSENHSNGRVLTPTITVKDGGRLDAKYVVCAGYGTTATLTKGNANGILVDGGSINAYFVGGDHGAVINMMDGEISTTYLGTMGKYIYNDDVANADDIEFTIDSMVCNSKINLNNGTVNIADCGIIGGGTSKVTVTGGTINGENASIEAPTIDISGKDTNFKVGYILAEDGTVTISGTTAHNFDNPYPDRPDRKDPFVAIIVVNELKAKTIIVDAGSLVYAKRAFVEAGVGESSLYTVTVGSALYTETYGSLGEGDHNGAYGYIPNDENGNQTIWGIQAIKIVYELYGDHFEGFAIPTGSDRTFIGNSNPSYYNFGENGGSIALVDLEHPYYEFIGWFYADGTERTTINTNQLPNTNQRTFYAKWKPKEVKFRVELPASLLNDNSVIPPIVGTEIMETELQNQLANGTLAPDNSKFVWTIEFSIPYWKEIQTDAFFDLADYQLYSYQVTGARINVDGAYTQLDYEVKVTRPMLEYYEALVAANGGNAEGVALVIELNQKTKTVQEIKFSLNKTNGRPYDAVFTGSSASIVNGVYTLRADIGYHLKDISGYDLAVSDTALEATGYTFRGWSTTPDGAVDYTNDALKELLVDGDFPVTLYAVWEANSYYIKFEAVPNNGTTNADGTYYFDENDTGLRPDEAGFVGSPYVVQGGNGDDGSTATHSVVLRLTYDNYLDANAGQTIPAAFRAGSVFDGWYYHKEDGTQIEVVTDEDLLSIQYNEFDKFLFDDEGSEATPAFTLYAHYRDVKVTYELNGGEWQDSGGDTREYSAHTETGGVLPLASYTNTNGDFISTTAEQYTANGNDFLAGDYRETLMRSGYTFGGWYTSLDGNEKVKHTPKFADVTVYAHWDANTYNVTLYSHDSNEVTSGATFVQKNGETWVDNTADYRGGSGIEVYLTVGQSINSALAGVNAWPSRDTWGTRGSADVEPRQLWGFTFFPLDPQISANSVTYADYILLCQQLYNAGQLFYKNESPVGGSVFTLPKKVVIGGNTYGYTISDMPNGSELAMYAQYREYTLVFVQYYLDECGNETEVLAHTVISNNGQITVNDLQKPSLTSPGESYALLDWYVNTTDFVNEEVYDPATVLHNWSQYAAEARLLGTYDITVYAVYGANKTISPAGTLTADGEAHTSSTIHEQRIAEFVIPENMLSDMLEYSITGFNGLELKSKSELQYYNFNTANNTVTLELTVVRAGEAPRNYDLDRSGGKLTEYKVQGGDKLIVTLYHSYVMSSDASFTGDIKFTFTNIAEDKQYLLLEDVTVTLTPSEYKLSFNANKPTNAQVTNNGSFEDNGSYSDTLEKSGNLKDNNPFFGVSLPVLIGYEANGNAYTQIWYSDEACTNEVLRIVNGKMSFTATPTFEPDGTLKLYTMWDAIEYTLTIDPSVLTDGWIITQSGISTSLSAGTYTVDYGTEFTFVGGAIPEFVLLHYATLQDERLEIDISKTGEAYIWTMPNSDTTVSINKVLELYLEEGSIVITNGASETHTYCYQDTWIKWPSEGSYNILMDKYNNADGSSTDNTLILNGNLDGVGINIGNLNVTGSNSISFEAGTYTNPPEGVTAANGTNVELTLSCTPNTEGVTSGASVSSLKNILVPANASLTISGKTGSELEFTPDVGIAAIGKQTGGDGSVITIKNCALCVNQEGDYEGIWFGGNDTTELTLENVTVEQGELDNYQLNRYVTYADTVTIKNSTLGTEDAPLSEPVYAENVLNIIGGEIYNEVKLPLSNIQKSAIGTDGGVTKIEKGAQSTKIKVTGSAGMTNRLFTGTMLIEDKDAEVIITNTLVVEMGHGDLNVSASEAVQTNGHTFVFGGNYLLLAEKVTDADTPSLIVQGNSVKNITVMPKSDTSTFAFDTLTVAADTILRLQQAENQSDVRLDAMDTVSIANGKTLTVTAGANGTVYLAADALKDAQGTYIQNYGTLKTETGKDIGGTAMDMTLNNVTATAANLYAENLTLNSCTVTCIDGKVGSYGIANGITTVTLSGNTNITATTIGALGAKYDTFTTVDVIGSNVFVEGQLVRDVYRIDYQYQTDNYNLVNGETVFRTTQDCTRSVAVSDPTEMRSFSKPTVKDGKTDKFVTWYIKKDNGEKISLFLQAAVLDKYEDRFTAFQNGLSFVDAVYAVNDANGIPTITVYAFYTISGTVVLKENQIFSAFEGVLNLTDAASDRGWSAFFTIESTRENGDDYAVTFDKAQPAGTKLILVWLEPNGNPKYYYYTVNGTETTIMFSDFTALGTSDKLNLGASEKERESFIITVDYTYATETPVDYTVGFGCRAAGQSTVDELCTANVSVLKSDETAEITVESGTVEIEMPNNDLYRENNYGYAILVEADNSNATVKRDLPYTADPILTYTADNGSTVTVDGKLIGGDMILFILGEYEQDLQTDFAVSGLPEGYAYNWSVVLLENFNQVNVLKTLSD